MLLFFLLPLGLIACGQLGLFSGKTPTDLGLHNAMLKAPEAGATNVVSSYANKQVHNVDNEIAPISFSGDSDAAFGTLKRLVAATNGATIIVSQPNYLYAQYRTPVWKFVDDVEFVLDAPASKIQMRSASRLGQKDFGTNRKRLEDIRRRFTAALGTGF